MQGRVKNNKYTRKKSLLNKKLTKIKQQYYNNINKNITAIIQNIMIEKQWKYKYINIFRFAFAFARSK